AFELLLSVAELEQWQPLAGQLGVLIPDGSGSLVGRGGLGADIHPKLPRRLVEVLVGKDGVGQPQLLPDALKEPAGHAPAEGVGEDSKRKAARIAERKGVGA